MLAKVMIISEMGLWIFMTLRMKKDTKKEIKKEQCNMFITDNQFYIQLFRGINSGK
jgi:hypothetical protein